MNKLSNYHPKIDNSGRIISHGRRNSIGRLDAIKKLVNFEGKTVLDLGCQNGFFSSEIAKDAKKVIAIDAERDFINQNKIKYGDQKNIEFMHSNISMELLRNISEVDVILCLSVFHHIIAPTNLHEFDSGLERKEWEELLKIMREKCNTLIFEIGSPEEKQPWAKNLKKIVPNTRSWILTNVFSDEFSEIKEIKGRNYNHKLIIKFPWLRKPLLNWPYGRKVLRILGLAPHDFRSIYVGVKNL